MRFLENIANPKIRDVAFIVLYPALLSLFASGLDLERVAPVWSMIFLLLAVVWSIGVYRVLGGLFGDVRIISRR